MLFVLFPKLKHTFDEGLFVTTYIKGPRRDELWLSNMRDIHMYHTLFTFFINMHQGQLASFFFFFPTPIDMQFILVGFLEMVYLALKMMFFSQNGWGKKRSKMKNTGGGGRNSPVEKFTSAGEIEALLKMGGTQQDVCLQEPRSWTLG